MRAFSLLVAAAALLAPAAQAAPAAAPTGGVAADARCLMTMAALASSQDANAASVGQAGVIYFAGRVKAEAPGYNFATELKTVAAGMNGQNLQAEANRCGPQVVAALQSLQDAQKSFGPPPAAAAPPAKK